MKKILVANKAFFLLFTIAMVLGALVLFTWDKSVLFFWVNERHSLQADGFFKVLTGLGNGLFAVSVAIVWSYWKNTKEGIFILVCFLLSGLITQLLKRQVFSDWPRPKNFFGIENIPHLVEGVSLHGSFSFPSGHTTSSFSVFTALALLSKNKRWGWLFCLLAIIAGYSRMYLSQHFLEDVLVGAMIGTGCTLVMYLRLEKWNKWATNEPLKAQIRPKKTAQPHHD